MGISLFGLTPAATYPSLIKFGDNSAISGVLRALSDGLGNDLPMQVSTAGVNFTGTLTVGGAGLSPASGVSGAIQFSDGSAFSSDATKFFWDNTNKRLGIGTNAPTHSITNIGISKLQGIALGGVTHSNLNTNEICSFNSMYLFNRDSGGGLLRGVTINNVGTMISSDGSQASSAMAQIKGSGSTSATTSLLVQNSSSSQLLKVTDDGQMTVISSNIYADILLSNGSAANTGIKSTGYTVYLNSNATNIASWSYQTHLNASKLAVGGTVGSMTPHSSSVLDCQSIVGGFLPPRMTTTQRDAIVTPATGLRIYNTTTNTNDTYNGTVWQSNSVSGVAGAIQFSNGSAFASDAANLFWDDTNNRLGVGTNAPTGKLQVTESLTTTGNNYSAITFDGTLTSRATASDTIFGFRNTQSIVATATGQTIIANDLTPNYTFFDANTDSVALRIGGLKNTQNNISAILMQQTATAGNNGLAIQPANTRWQMGYCAGQSNSMGSSPRVVFGENGIRIGKSSGPASNLFEIQGSGSTSATTSLLVQNSSGTAAMTVRDNLSVIFGGEISSTSGQSFLFNGAFYNTITGRNHFGGAVSISTFLRVGANGDPVSSAQLQVDSTTRGFLPPVMTTTQKNAIASPASGLVVYDSTTNKLNYNDGAVWKEVTPDGYTGLVTVNATPPVTFDIQNGIIVNVI